jgi:UDP-N-acetylglucosamine transferase subunit ALG13
VPVIRYLLDSGHTVTFAGNEWQRKYINETFSAINTIHLDGYDVRYGKNASGFLPALFMQLPRIIKTIKAENNWLKELAAKHHFDGIISDNRYGLYHSAIPNVIMTHQIAPQSGLGISADKIVASLHAKRLKRFNECWIVDVEGTPNLAGRLSHPQTKPNNGKYIGLLTQLEQTPTSEDHLLVMLSGPEPQRTILSDLLWKQLKSYDGKIVFVEGSEIKKHSEIPEHIEYHQRITADVLTPIIAKASIIICRSGYSTLMDLIALQKKAIIIPTPGQTEQEYLGKHLHNEGVFFCAEHENLYIGNALEKAKSFPFNTIALSNAYEQHKPVIDNWLEKL